MNGHIAVVGLGFGDEGKGATVDWLCRRDGDERQRPIAVARLGGHQAGHNVVEPGGRHHTFSQFGSGTLAGVPTFLTRYMTVNPMAMITEAEHLIELGIDDPYRMVKIDGSCLIITPFHQWGNLSNTANLAHGTTGKGHGEAIRLSLAYPGEVLRMRDLHLPSVSAWILSEQKARFEREYPDADVPDYMRSADWLMQLCDVYASFARTVRVVQGNYLHHLMNLGPVIFEHSQGVLLDEWLGFHPHTTWSTTTFENIDKLAAEAGWPKPYHLGVLRTYTTRHGAGPFPTYDPDMAYPEPHNDSEGMQGLFRQGHFDAVLHRYAVSVAGGVDGIALTHCDRLLDREVMVHRYSREGHEPYIGGSRHLPTQENMGRRLDMAVPVFDPITPTPDAVEKALGVPVVVTSSGPTHEHRDVFWNEDKKIFGMSV